MQDFGKGQRVEFVRDYPVEDIVIPEGTQGVVLAAGSGIYEVGCKLGNFLVEERFLGEPQGVEAYGHEYDIYLGDLPKGGGGYGVITLSPPDAEPEPFKYEERVPYWKYREDLCGGYEPRTGYPGPEYQSRDKKEEKKILKIYYEAN